MAVEPIVRPYTTYEDLCRLPSDGHRYELIDGEVYLAPSPSTWHQEILFRLASLLRQSVRDRSRVFFAPLDVVLDRATALQPDVILVRQENLSIVKDVIHGVPDLVVEVLSPSTTDMDRGQKMGVYARYGVAEYWIVDPVAGSLEIHRLDRQARVYRLVATFRPSDVVTTPLLPGFSLGPEQLFAPVE